MNATKTSAGFTADATQGNKINIGCWGAHHRDAGILGNCDGCGAQVAKTEKGRIVDITSGLSFGLEFSCWANAHECDPDRSASHQAMLASQIGSGEIIKGQTVTVVRGRKVPKGTTGTIIWIGDDAYGKARVGIKTEDGETHFTAASNVEATS